MRAICFLPDLDGGGAQRSMINLVNEFPRLGVEPLLVSARSDGPARRWLAPGLRHVELDLSRSRSAPPALARLIRAERPEVVFATMVPANVAAAMAWRMVRPRPLLMLRETNSHRARADLGIVTRRLIGWAYRRADRVIALSRGVGRELVEDYRLDPERVVTIGNPVNVDRLASQAEAARRGTPPWGAWAGDGSVILAAGRLTRQKGFDLLLEAFARDRSAGRRLVIAGDGPDRGDLMARIVRLDLSDAVLMPGFVDDLAPWMAHADLFVLSSRWEGFGHVIVEAMACGTPVVAADCPHGPSDIIEHQNTGLLIKADDAGELAGAIDRMITNPELRTRLARAGRRAAGRFASAKIAAAYAELFVAAARRGERVPAA